MYKDKQKAKKGLEKLIAAAFKAGEISDSERAELSGALVDALEYAQKRTRASQIIREEVGKLNTTVDLKLPSFPPLDLSKDIEAVKRLAESEAATVENLGKIIAAAAPIITTALFA